MSYLKQLNNDGLAKTIDCYLVNSSGLWKELAVASSEMQAWDLGCGRHLVYSDLYDVCSYLDITVTGRKIRRTTDYQNSLLTVQVNNGEEVYKAEIAFRGWVTLEEAKAILEGQCT